MEKKGIVVLILVILVIFSTVGITLNLVLYASVSPSITGKILDEATVGFTQAGVAGISLPDNIIDFGTGHYDGTCYLNYSILNSNTSKTCWINTTTFPYEEEVHVVENIGSTVIAVNVSLINVTDAEQFFCDVSQGCLSSTDSRIRFAAANNETSSCISGLITSFQTLASDTANFSAVLCERLGYPDSKDSLKTYIELQVPRDAIGGSKTLNLLYTGIPI